MSQRLVFIDRPDQAPPPTPGTEVVVLDAAWTPPADHGGSPRPIRPIVAAVVEALNLVDGSLSALDAWGAATRMPQRLTADGVTWWPQVRMLLRWDIHELFLWRHVLDRLDEAGDCEEIVVPASRPILAAAARSRRIGPSSPNVRSRTPRVVVVGGPGLLRRAASLADRSIRRYAVAVRLVRLAALVGRAARYGVSLVPWWPRPAATAGRTAVLETRYAHLRQAEGLTLVIAWPRAFHVIDDAGLSRRTDPHLSGATDRLAAQGRPVAAVGLGVDHRRDEDWASLQADPTLLPESLLARRFVRPRDILINSAALSAAVAATRVVPLPVGNHDLGPEVARLIDGFTGAWLDRQLLRTRWVERFLRDLRPYVLFTDREGSRTAWLHAARRQNVPTVAIQHGMIYAGSPEYYGVDVPAAVRPDTTCVFGAFERDLLVLGAGYPPTSVVLTGSPRRDDRTEPAAAEERDAVRGALGVAPGDRLLVVSVAHNQLMGELHTFSALARVLGGPLPGIHLAIKLHPQDDAEPRHAEFLEGLAVAGGYPPPTLSIVRDVDIYRLLQAADAHLGQYSTVLTDAVVAGTPNMIILGQAYADALGYVEAGVATAVRSVEDVRTFMADPRPPDPAARARFIDAHFRQGDAVGRIAAVLTAAVDRQPLAEFADASSTPA